ncbi:MAG: hypothetical protein AAGE98_07770 [Actinomycetota bacterium]
MTRRIVATLGLALALAACGETTTQAETLEDAPEIITRPDVTVTPADADTAAATVVPEETVTAEGETEVETLCVDDPTLETEDQQVCAVDAGYDGIRGAQFGESIVVGFVDDDVDRVFLLAGPDLGSIDEIEIETQTTDGRRVFIAEIDWRETLAVVAERGAEQHIHVNERLSGPGRQDPQILVADGTVMISGQPVGWTLRVSRGRTLTYQLESPDGALGGGWGVGPTGAPEPFEVFASDFGWENPVPVVIAMVRTLEPGTATIGNGETVWTAATAPLPHGDHVAVIIADRAVGAEPWTLEFSGGVTSSFQVDITERLRASLPYVPPGYPLAGDEPSPLPTVTYPSN